MQHDTDTGRDFKAQFTRQGEGNDNDNDNEIRIFKVRSNREHLHRPLWARQTVFSWHIQPSRFTF